MPSVPAPGAARLSRIARVALVALLAMAPLPAPAEPIAAAAAEGQQAPIAMSDPSGQGLALETLDVSVAAHGPLALTELSMLFRNPLDRQIEGKFTCMLPTGATLSRFAKEVNGALMEGEVVERLRATQVYTEILQSMRDPALLEADQGNRFRARVFPIAPRGTVRLVLSYTSVNPVGADGQRHIVVPLRGLGKIGRFKFLGICRPLPGETVELADASGQSRVLPPRDRIVYADEAGKSDFVPDHDLTLSFKPQDGAPPAVRVLAGAFQMAVFRPPAPATAPAAVPAGATAGAPPPSTAPVDWHLLMDTSASGADQGPARLDTWRQLLEALTARAGTAPMTIEAFDLGVAPVTTLTPGAGPAPGSSRDAAGAGAPTGSSSAPATTTAPADGITKAIEILRARHFLGATDLAKVLAHVGDLAREAHKASATGRHMFVLVTDGIPTLGARDAGDLVRALGDWPASCTLHVVVAGGTQDATVTAALARAGHGRVITLPIAPASAASAPTAPAGSSGPSGPTGPSPAAAAADAAAAELLRPLGPSYQVYDEGAEWIEPKTFDDVRPGMELVAFSRLKKNAKPQAGLTDGHGLDLRATGPAIDAPDFAPLLEREAYRAYLARLEHLEQSETDVAKKNAMRQERVTISVEHRVLCPLTSLLVLENESDYERYGIARKALADILAVGKKGIELIHREATAPVDEMGGRFPHPEIGVMKDAPTSARDAQPHRTIGGGAAGGAHGRGREELDSNGFDSSGYDRRGFDRAGSSRVVFSGGPAAAQSGVSYDAGSASGGVAGAAAAEPADAAKPEPGAASDDLAPGGAGGGSAGDLADREESRAVRRERATQSDMLSAQSARSLAEPGPAPVQAEAPAALPPPEPENAPIGPGGVPAFAPPRSAPEAAPAAGGVGNAGPAMPNVVGAPVPAGSPAMPDVSPTGPTQPPDWTKQAGWRPSDADLSDLRTRIEKDPLDRNPRNALAYALLKAGKPHDLVAACLDWQRFDAENPMVYEYLGDAFHALHDQDTAVRGFSSIAEVSPGDSGLLNRAGYLALKAGQIEMAKTLFRTAIERRPDHANNYRGLALALWTEGSFEEAVKALADGLARDYHPRYGDVKRVLREEASLILGGWLKAFPDQAQKVKDAAARIGADPAYHDALRFALHWETDGTDVDLHVVDPSGEECFYSHKLNQSGVQLYEDLTQGLGPETIVVPPGHLQKGVYHVGVNYFSAGPMGVSRGIVVVFWPSKDGKPVDEIEPFCLLPDLTGAQRDMRHVAIVESSGNE